MKKLTSIFALFIALLMIINSAPAFAFDTTNGLITITLQENFSKDITVNLKQYDGNSMADVDCSKVVLEGKLEQDDVYLAADGIFDSVDASGSKHTVKITNFRLEGNDKNKYILKNSIDEINKRAFIMPKEISVEPEIKSIYFGQDIPSNIEVDIDHHVIITGDTDDYVHLTAELSVDCDNPEIGKYKFLIRDQTTDNSNYTLKVDDDVLFEIKEYDPGVEAIPENKNNIYFSNMVKLTAPDGFYISSNKSDFKPEITLKIEKTPSAEPKEVSYYLRNIDDNSDEYNAISKELKYSYFCSTDQPVITGAEISTEDSDEILKFINFGVVSGGSATIKVSAKGTNIDQPTSIYLSYGDKTESRTVENGEKIGDVYYYSAEFAINVPEDKCISSSLRAYASNSSGSGSLEDLKITDGNGNYVYGNNKNYIILDKVKPSASNITVYYDNKSKYIEVSGLICDVHSGIDKIEYKFNKDSQYTEYGKNTNSKYFENGSSSAFFYSHNPNNKINFKVIVKYDDVSFTENGANILSIKITDNAGNVYENSGEYKQEGNGYDTEAPVVTYINIKTQNEKNALNNVLNFFLLVTFLKKGLKLL